MRTAQNLAVFTYFLCNADLSSNPFPNQTKKLIGSEHSFRIRVGNYRIIYDVLSKVPTIEIIRVGHRRDIYER